MFYSKSTGGFYDAAIHGDNIPDDVVCITKERHAELIAGQAAGQRIEPDENGFPVLADPPLPTTEQLAAKVRAERDSKLLATGWLIERHHEQLSANIATTLTEELYLKLLNYRQALRDVPAQAGFPETIKWPIKP